MLQNKGFFAWRVRNVFAPRLLCAIVGVGLKLVCSIHASLVGCYHDGLPMAVMSGFISKPAGLPVL